MSEPAYDEATPTNNIILNKGEDYEVTGWIEDDNGNALDISGDTFRAQVRDTCGGSILATFTFSLFLDTSVTPNIWKYIRSMSQTDIAAITKGSAVWDQFQEAVGGLSNKMFTGTVKINCNVTSPTI